jgi:nucleoside-diphosphate-sugar epimerase
MNATPQHVVFGTGAIGLATLDALRRRGERVRLVNRSGTAPDPGGSPSRTSQKGGGDPQR